MILRLLRLGLLFGLALFSSGLPQAVAAAADDCCEGPCEGSLHGRHCPPNCPLGSCAKTRPAIGGAIGFTASFVAPRADVVFASDIAPVLPVPTSDLFHPPRA